MKNDHQTRARIQELQAKPDLSSAETGELGELQDILESADSTDVDHEVPVTVRFPLSVWEGLSLIARDQRMSKNAAVIRAVEEFAGGKHEGAAQEIGGLAQALSVLDEDACPDEHAATRRAFRSVLSRHYGHDIREHDSEARPKSSNGGEDDLESEEQLRKQYRSYEEEVKRLPWLKQHSRRFRSFDEFRDANAAERQAEYKKLGIATPWTPKSSGQKKGGATATRK